MEFNASTMLVKGQTFKKEGNRENEASKIIFKKRDYEGRKTGIVIFANS